MPAFDSDAILQVLLARTIGMRDTIRVSEVLGSTIPRGVKVYVRADVERRLAAEVERSDHISRIGQSAFEAAHLRGLYVRHAADAYLLRRDEYTALLENAVRFTENYLCRPRWTLRSFLFHDAPTLPAPTLLARLEWIPEYAYLPQLLARVITDRKLNGLSDAACSELIAKIDDAVVREHRPRELARLTSPIFSFYLLSADPGSNSIPLRPLLVFFEDKGLLGLREHLQGVCHMRNRTDISLGELEELTEDFFGEQPPLPQTEPVPEPEPPHEEEIPPANGPAEGVAALPAIAEPVPVAPEPTPGVPESTSSVPESTPNVTEPTSGVTESTSDIPESTRADNEPVGEPSGEELPPPAPSVELQSMISEDQRKRFISVLCDKDEVFYELIVARLDEIPTWIEASAYIRELFEINSIDPFHHVAVMFTDIVQRRFPPDGTLPS
jgi:hypothetical protein